MNAIAIVLLSACCAGSVDAANADSTMGEPVSSAPVHAPARLTSSIHLDVPFVVQARERCGQAALAMVLGYYGVDPRALGAVDAAYDPVLRGSLITDLAGAARRAGYDAAVATLTTDVLVDLLAEGVPAIVLYQNGSGPMTVRHYGVITGWDARKGAFTLNDGTASPRSIRRDDLEKRWKTAGSQALIVRARVP